MELHSFKEIVICFNHREQLLIGELNGTVIQWEFHCTHPAFKRYFPHGVLTNRTKISKLPTDAISLIEEFYQSTNMLFQ